MKSDYLYKLLNGLISTYKPSHMNVHEHGQLVKKLFAKTFNRLPIDNTRIVTDIIRNGNNAEVVTVPDTMSNPLVSGLQFFSYDFEMYAPNPLPSFSSGVQVYGIGPIGLALSGKMFEENMYMNAYRLTIMMGRATHSGTPESNTILRTTWRHIRFSKLEYLLQNLVNESLGSSYVSAGLIPNSQEAFEALSNNNGLLRPKFIATEDQNNNDPVSKSNGIIYGLTCTKFNPPFFTIELHSINENMDLLMNFMNKLGVKLKTALVMTQCRRLRQGRFSADKALLLSEINHSIIESHMEYTESLHSFESLQTEGERIGLLGERPATKLLDGNDNEDNDCDNRYLD